MADVKTTKTTSEYITRKVDLRKVFNIKPGQRAVFGKENNDVYVKILIDSESIIKVPKGEECMGDDVDGYEYTVDTTKEI